MHFKCTQCLFKKIIGHFYKIKNIEKKKLIKIMSNITGPTIERARRYQNGRLNWFGRLVATNSHLRLNGLSNGLLMLDLLLFLIGAQSTPGVVATTGASCFPRRTRGRIWCWGLTFIVLITIASVLLASFVWSASDPQWFLHGWSDCIFLGVKETIENVDQFIAILLFDFFQFRNNFRQTFLWIK